MNSLESTLKKCEEFGFNQQITHEVLWNTAYQLGRSRWYWGPRWFVSVQGWFNTKFAKSRRPEVPAGAL